MNPIFITILVLVPGALVGFTLGYFTAKKRAVKSDETQTLDTPVMRSTKARLAAAAVAASGGGFTAGYEAGSGSFGQVVIEGVEPKFEEGGWVCRTEGPMFDGVRVCAPSDVTVGVEIDGGIP